MRGHNRGMTYAYQVQQSAGRLSTWLNVWRILCLIAGALYLLGIGAAFLFGLSSSSEAQALGGAEWLFLMLPLALIGLITWVYWQLLTWGKEWVDRSAALVTGTPFGAAPPGGEVGRLQQLDATLGRWIMGAVWATVALGALGVLGGLGIFLTDSASGGRPSMSARPRKRPQW